MGMYIEFVCVIELKKDMLKEVINILNNMIEGEDRYDIILFYLFFECCRWRWLFIMDSYFFLGRSNMMFEYDDIVKIYYLIIRSNLKNYDDEINKFLNWIKLYI